ncbi:MAG TPA: GAF domain-containing sensor histidine kinase, partial [Terriglobales bacterium]|nr:GAF domain-containing sensor histidine kinase [Terriglobales bacterium]
LKDQRIRALHEINLAITSTLELGAVLNILLEKIDLLLPYSAATIELRHRQSSLLKPAACRNLDQRQWMVRAARVEDNPAKIVLERRVPLIIANMQTDRRVREHDFYRQQGFFSYMGVPLTAKSETLGVLGFYTKAVHDFTESEVQFLETLAGQVAIAIHNSQLYETIKSQAAELEQANEVKSEFLSVVSHELRTPINVMMGYVELVQQGLLGEIKPQQNDALKKSLDHSRNLLGLVTDMLQATRIQSHDVKLDHSTVSLKQMLEDLRTHYALSLKTDLTVRWEVPVALPHIETDGNKVKHILQSLIDNAIKFTDAGTVQIAARILPETDKLELQVSDTGRGIPAEKIPLIFDLFRQLDNPMTRSHDGLGLGLFLVKKHTELLGGELKVVSELGKGSTFTVVLPIHRNFHTV